MRLLVIDSGNTRIKWAVHEDGEWRRNGALATSEAERLADELAQAPVPQRVVIANVAGERVAQHILGALEAWGVEPDWVVSRQEQCGVRSGYAQPAQLGPDRWAALIGARHLCAGACIIVNAGTTMTVDTLSAESIFLGGFIVPGFELMREALARNTAQLKLQEGGFSFFPDNTGDAIVSGALNALAGAVDRMARYMTDIGEDEPAVLISGGNAELLIPRVNGHPRLVDNLVLEGLVRIGAGDVGA